MKWLLKLKTQIAFYNYQCSVKETAARRYILNFQYNWLCFFSTTKSSQGSLIIFVNWLRKKGHLKKLWRKAGGRRIKGRKRNLPSARCTQISSTNRCQVFQIFLHRAAFVLIIRTKWRILNKEHAFYITHNKPLKIDSFLWYLKELKYCVLLRL